MTLHLHFDYQCYQCNANYIPYDKGVCCPNCNSVGDWVYDFIPKAVRSLKNNKEENGSYTPGAWYVGSLADHFLSILFNIFDNYDAKGGDFKVVTKKLLTTYNWGEMDYLEKHIYDIASQVMLSMEIERMMKNKNISGK